MTKAVVYPERDNTAAVTLYESCGFKLAATDFDYELDITSSNV